MNRSHKHELEKLKSKNDYNKHDLEIAKELLHQEDPPFQKDVKKVIKKITKYLSLSGEM